MRTLSMAAGLLLVSACGAADGSGSSPDGSSSVPIASATEPASAIARAELPALSGAPTVEGREYAIAGAGECRRADEAYIYGVASAMWLVQHTAVGGLGSLSLTVWRPRDGGADQLSLSISGGDHASRISTVLGGEKAGSGSVRLESLGEGLRITVEGVDEKGAPVRVDLRCNRFALLEAVGG